MAEAVGFEPTKACTSLVFKTSSIGRSDRPPRTSLQVFAREENSFEALQHSGHAIFFNT
ncbi:MAG: hypothetical protein RL556_589 [Actinomycetota bacterium]